MLGIPLACTSCFTLIVFWSVCFVFSFHPQSNYGWLTSSVFLSCVLSFALCWAFLPCFQFEFVGFCYWLPLDFLLSQIKLCFCSVLFMSLHLGLNLHSSWQHQTQRANFEAVWMNCWRLTKTRAARLLELLVGRRVYLQLSTWISLFKQDVAHSQYWWAVWFSCCFPV